MQIELQTDSFLSSSEHAAPPKKPPRPGASSHPAGVSVLNSTDSYNEGVKVPNLPHRKLLWKTKLFYSFRCVFCMCDFTIITAAVFKPHKVWNSTKRTHTRTHSEAGKISICTYGSPSGAASMPTDAVCQASLKSSLFLKPLSHTQAHNCSAGPLIKRSLHTKNPAVSIPARFPDAVGQRAGGLASNSRNAVQNGKYN